MALSRAIATYAAGGTLGSLFVAHGLRDVLRASSTESYVRLDGFVLAWGFLVAFVGWAILIVTYVNLRAELAEQ